MIDKKKFCFLFIINLFLCGTSLFFAPLEVYLGNLDEFTFPPTHVWWMLLLVVCVLALSFALLESLINEKACIWISVFSCVLGLCFYLQSLFFNSQLQELTGEAIEFTSGTVIVNILLWVGIIGFFCLLSAICLKSDEGKKLKDLLMIVSAGMIVIQLSGLISTCASLTEQEKDKNLFFSTDAEFQLSDNVNVLYFILDTCDMQYVNEALEEDPRLFDELTGFICYPDATSMYSRTYPALPYLMTGEKCFFDIPYLEYLKNAYASSNFLSKIKSKGTDIRIYTSLEYVDSSAYQFIDNVKSYQSEKISVLSVPKMFKAMARLGGYRIMPYLAKPYFSYTIDPINRYVLNNPPEDYYTLTNNDFEFHDRLLKNRVSVNHELTGAFRLYHLFGPHPGCYMNEYAEYDPNASQTAALRGDIFILNEYIRQLKSLGIYDKTAIIVTADHGNQNENEDLQLKNPACCIMLLKKVGADPLMPIEFSDTSVCHEDLFATVLAELGLDASGYTPPLFEHEEDRNRERTYYYTAQRSWGDGEVALKEYRISGDARDFSSWELTGNEWEILYSMNAVSKNK